MDFQAIGAVLQRIINRVSRRRKLARFAHRDKASIHLHGHRCRKDEAPRLHANQVVGFQMRTFFHHGIDRRFKPSRIFEQRGDISENNSFLRKIGNIPNERFNIHRKYSIERYVMGYLTSWRTCHATGVTSSSPETPPPQHERSEGKSQQAGLG